MKVFAKFDEIPSMILEVIKETKRYGHTFGRSFVRSDNVKTVYPPTNTVCGGIKMARKSFVTNKSQQFCLILGVEERTSSLLNALAPCRAL